MNRESAGSIAASLHTRLSRRHVAALFLPPVWQKRKCGWEEFEVTSPFAEIIIEADSPILLHGDMVDVESNVDQILSPLRLAGIAHSGELYDSENELIRRFEWGVIQESEWSTKPKIVGFRRVCCADRDPINREAGPHSGP